MSFDRDIINYNNKYLLIMTKNHCNKYNKPWIHL